MEDKILNQLEEKLGRGRIKINEPLSAHTTFQIGGPADYYFEAGTVGELENVVEIAKKMELPYFILGGGSNILIGDKGFKGLVIKNNCRQIKIVSYKGKMEKGKLEAGEVMVEADAGVPFNQLVRFTLEESLGGLEEFLGLPGSVGGAVSVNAHWRDKRVRDFIISEKKTSENVLLSVIFKLKKENDKEALWQRGQATVEFRSIRHPKNPSAGCIFRNIEKSDAMRIGTPKFTTSAGFLIEAAGLKGKKMGDIQISDKHSNFMINLGGGKASDVVELIDTAKKEVYEKFKVRLQEEVVKVGEF